MKPKLELFEDGRSGYIEPHGSGLFHFDKKRRALNFLYYCLDYYFKDKSESESIKRKLAKFNKFIVLSGEVPEDNREKRIAKLEKHGRNLGTDVIYTSTNNENSKKVFRRRGWNELSSGRDGSLFFKILKEQPTNE